MTYLEARMIGSRPKADPTVAEIIANFREHYADVAATEAAATARNTVPVWVQRTCFTILAAAFAGALVMPA